MHTIRLASPADLEGIRAIFDQLDRYHGRSLPRVYRKPDGPTRSVDDILNILADPEAALFVAECEDRIVGFVHVCVRDSVDLTILRKRRYARVDNVAVLDGFQRRGIGRALMKRAHRWAVQSGAEEVELNVWEFNQGAIALYESMGYRTASRRMRMALAPEGAETARKST